ncbi:MAG: GNAT family N-acetyltransferase [Candidatus Babeliales bacterium]
MKQLLFLLLGTVCFAPMAMGMCSYEKVYSDPGRLQIVVAYYVALRQEVGRIQYDIKDSYIMSLEVSTAMQGKRIGSELFRYAVKDMKDHPVVEWFAVDTAIGFYIKQGAKIEEAGVIGGAYMSIDPKVLQD